MRRAFVVVAAMAVLLTAPLRAQKPDAIKLYLFAAGSAFVDERTDVLKDVRQHMRSKKVIALVDDPAQADASVEVIKRQVGLSDRDRYRMSPIYPYIVFLKVTAGSYEWELIGDSHGIMGRRFAAKEAGGKVLKWVKVNRERLIAARR